MRGGARARGFSCVCVCGNRCYDFECGVVDGLDAQHERNATFIAGVAVAHRSRPCKGDSIHSAAAGGAKDVRNVQCGCAAAIGSCGICSLLSSRASFALQCM